MDNKLTNSGLEFSDSAILFLDPVGEMSASNNHSMAVDSSRPLDGHQILDQVQLDFIPTTLASSTMGLSRPNFLNAEPQLSSVVVTGTMESQRNRDTDFLVGSGRQHDDDTQPIDLGSPVGAGPSSSTKYTIWQFDYYARYFDLNTDVFFRRILWSLLPLTAGGEKGTYIDRYIHSNPDLYGPFWIPLTLAFTISICDDIIKYLNSTMNPITMTIAPSANGTTHKPPVLVPKNHPLSFEFDRMNMATTITFSYVILAPLILWSFCQWRHCTKLYSFLECLCAYGYSLSLFIPVTILALVNIRQIQFILFASAAFLSGSVLLISFAPVVHSDPSRSFKFAYVCLIFILVSHLVLALFYLYLFL